jgi:hypothetical protein
MKKTWMVALATFVGVLAFGAVAYAMVDIRAGEEEAAADAYAEVYELELLEQEIKKAEELLPATGEDAMSDEEAAADREKDETDALGREHDKEPAEGSEDEKVAEEAVVEMPVAEGAPPELSITFPEDGAHFKDDRLVFKGTATPGSMVMAGKYAADIDDAGNWAIKLILEPGGNKAVFRAENDFGVAEAAVVVHLDVENHKPAESDHEFTAHQVYGHCEETVPYDVFFGKTAPGAEVLVLSEFGSGETVANESGEYELRVEFPAAPFGKPIAVHVKSMGLKKTFEFTSYSNNSHDLVAYQVHGMSETEVPRDVFWGYTAPNAEVMIWSEFGVTYTTANGDGAFEVEATFPEAPYNQPFVVKVKSIEQKVVFEFVNKFQAEEGGA